MKKAHPIYLTAVIVLALGLQACGQVQSALGQKKNPPDEFQVVARPPLSMPPNFALRPPAPGSTRPQQDSVKRGAERLVFTGKGAKIKGTGTFALAPSTQGSTAPSQPPTPAEMSMRGKLGVNQAQPGIRETVNRETATYAYETKYPIDRLLFWKDDPENGVVLDAEAEKKRLQENSALGKPVTDGETPSITRKQGGLLQKLF